MPSWISLLTDRIHACNPVLAGDFRQWLWQPGMYFLDDRLWWGKQKKRIAPHEGIDLACYMDQQGKERWFAPDQMVPGLFIPAIFSGRVVQLQQDFLNWSVYIRHDQFCRDGAVLHTVYGHVQPKEEICISQKVAGGEPMAVLAAYPRSTVPLHLHFTVAWIPESIAPHQLSWQMLSENQHIILLDPLKTKGWNNCRQRS
ncbi:Peptidase M23 domain-containing protein [Candidatus Electrothrix laxa]